MASEAIGRGFESLQARHFLLQRLPIGVMAAMQQYERHSSSGYEYVRSSGGIAEYRLTANGLTLLFMEMRAAPVALLMLTYDVGSRDERPGVRGGSHMLEHMMFKGTDRFNKRNKTSIHEVLGATGGHVNATTWLDYTNFYNVVPSSQWQLAADIEADRMRGMLLSPSDLDAERDVVLNEYDQLVSSPFERINQAVWSAAFGDHPYARPVIGTREDIAGFTREALLQHYDRHYWPNNATVTIIGDLAREEVLATIDGLFGQLSRGGQARDIVDVASETQGEQRIEVRQTGAPDYLVLAYHSPAGLDRDTDALELLAIILASGRTSRLYRRLVLAGLASDVWSSISRLRSQGLFQVQTLLAGSGTHSEVEQHVRAEIGEVCRQAVTLDELERAKGYARGRLLTSRDGAIGMAMQLNEAIAMGDWTHYVTASERLAAVSAADIQSAANRYLGGARPTVGMLMPGQGNA